MAFDLRKEVEELRKRGASLGLNHDDIDYAILKSLGELPSNQDTKTSRGNFKLCKYFFIILATMLCILFLVIGAVIVAAEHDKQVGLLIGRTFADLTYPVVRLIRLSVLPLHRWFDLSQMYTWECLINNPSFEPGGPDCEICVNAKRVPIKLSHLLSQPEFKAKFFEPGFSVIVRNVSGYADQNHTYQEFLDLYHANKFIMDKDACEFYIGEENNTVKSLGELLDNWDHYKPEGHIVGWKLCYGNGFREVRKLYRRPYFVSSEGSLEKMVQLLQPSGKYPESVELPHTSFDNVWYAQVDGSTEVQLAPVAGCENECKTHTVNLIKGDVLFYTQQIWRATMTNRNNEPAMVFVASFA